VPEGYDNKVISVIRDRYFSEQGRILELLKRIEEAGKQEKISNQILSELRKLNSSKSYDIYDENGRIGEIHRK